MFRSRVFTFWFISAAVVGGVLFAFLNDWRFLVEHWYYPAIMVLGAFVAGVTPQGGGAVAFPMLSVLLDVDREIARDFSMMVQRIGLTSATIFILSNKNNVVSRYKPLAYLIPVACAGFVVGMHVLHVLQVLPVHLVQALFLSLVTTFTTAYVISARRGASSELQLDSPGYASIVGVLFTGGALASLFGVGPDILLYSLLVTRMRMNEKIATHMSIIVMAGTSVFGCAYRYLYDQDLTVYQVRIWLCAYLVVLFMAPLGAYVLSRINVSWMLKAVPILNLAQLAYFNLHEPSWPKMVASIGFSVVLMIASLSVLRRAPPDSLAMSD